MKAFQKNLLNTYFDGKDNDKYRLLEEIYEKDAVVEFLVKPSNIRFPSLIQGCKEIARILSKEFNQNNTDIKSYYFWQEAKGDEALEEQKWLVIMKERETQKLKVGAGLYHWYFSKNKKLQRHYIQIEQMVYVDSKSIECLQQDLTYPQTNLVEVMNAFACVPELQDILAYLEA